MHHQAQLVADEDVTARRIALRHLENPRDELRGRLVRHTRVTLGLRGQALRAVLFERVLDFVEVAATDAGALAGEADVLQFLRQGQHAHASFDKLLSGAHDLLLVVT